MNKKMIICVCLVLVVISLAIVGLVWGEEIIFNLKYTVEYDDYTGDLVLKHIRFVWGNTLELPEETPDGQKITTFESEDTVSNKTVRHLVIPNSYKWLPNAPFYAYKCLESVYFGKNVEQIYGTMFSESANITSIEVAPDNPHFISENNCVIKRDTKKMVLACKTSTIPDWVEEIDSNTFTFVKGLERITVPESVKVIHPSAFADVPDLKEVVFEGEVEIIKDCTFDSSFYDYSDLTITFLKVKEAPDSWEDGWCPENVTVIWAKNDN